MGSGDVLVDETLAGLIMMTTSHWGGAQWVLATFWLIFTVGMPVIRAGIIANGGTFKDSWADYWRKWSINLIERATLAAILAWGGFW